MTIATSPTTTGPTMSPSAADRAAAWRLTHQPRFFWPVSARPRMPADLARAFEEALLAYAACPGSFVMVELRGEKLSMVEIIHHAWRCGDELPRRVATAMSCIDPFQPERWMTGRKTYSQAAVFLKAVVSP